MHQTLETSGHGSYTLRIIPEADHEVAIASTAVSQTFAPGYINLMVRWMESVVAGEKPSPWADQVPPNEAPVPAVSEPALLWQGVAQVWVFGGIQMLLLGSVVLGWMHRPRQSMPGRGEAFSRWLSRFVGVTVFLVTWGVYGAAGYVAITAGAGVGRVVAGRPLFWLVLQLTAVFAAAAAIALLLLWIGGRHHDMGIGRQRMTLPLIAGLLFVPWATWRQLFSL